MSMEGIIIILLVVVICVVMYSYFQGEHVVNLSGDSLVITFVGILATFIVIGNAQQVREIRNDMHTELQERKIDMRNEIQVIRDEMENDKKECEDLIKENRKETNTQLNTMKSKMENIEKEQNDLSLRLDDIQQKIEKNRTEIEGQIGTSCTEINIAIKDIQDLQTYQSSQIIDNSNNISLLNNTTSATSKNIKELLYGILLLNNDDTSKLLVNLIYEAKDIYTIVLDDEKQTQVKATIQSVPKLQFINIDDQQIVTDIKTIDGLSYDSHRITTLFELIMGLDQESGDISSDVNNEENNSVL